jgi:hypothetical protein
MDPSVDSSDDLALIKLLIDALTTSSQLETPFTQEADKESGFDECISSHRSPGLGKAPRVHHMNFDEPTNITTVMIRNIPRKCTQRMLVADICAAGFGETVDFVYLPVDVSVAKNLGYAFVNFTHSDFSQSFREVFHKNHLSCMRGSRTGLSVSPAVIQGFQANVENVMKNASVHRIRNPEYLPLILNKETGQLGPCIMEMDIKRRHSNTSQASTMSFSSLQDWSGSPESVFDLQSFGELKVR